MRAATPAKIAAEAELPPARYKVQPVEVELPEKQKAKPGLTALSSAVGRARSGSDLP
jgi:hypothetical protein